MLLLNLLACGGPVWGTWMFTKDVTLPTGSECLDDLTHNFVGAYEPIAAGDDPSWTETDTGDMSPEVFFARVEQTATGAVLVTGTEALPGDQQDDGSWLFYWTGTERTTESLDHVTGYAYDHTADATDTLRIAGTIEANSFTGTWEYETSLIDAWTESDSWSEEAAAYVGGTGNLPASTYLLVIDGAGTEVAATNTQAAYDCGETGCTMTASESCAYRYTLTGQATEFDPADSRWVEDAGQAAGS
jgi:hypothetical protein